MNFDWTKYKRVFAFGCSFTKYIYPTWADIIANEMPNCEYYNFAKSGMGNLGISSRIAEANTKFKFNETDLVLVMYSTMYREDRWIEGSWQTHGNVFNQGYYDKSFVKNYVDPVGCLIRDLSLIELSSNYLKSLPCDNLLLRASTLEDECPKDARITDMVVSIKETYSDLWNSFPKSLYDVVAPNGWVNGIERTLDGNKFIDNHPTPIEYYNYLKEIGINLSDNAREYAEESERRCHTFKDFRDWINYFPELNERLENTERFTF